MDSCSSWDMEYVCIFFMTDFDKLSSGLPTRLTLVYEMHPTLRCTLLIMMFMIYKYLGLLISKFITIKTTNKYFFLKPYLSFYFF